MSRFYGTVDGSAATTASRRGFGNIRGHIRGWDLGVSVDGFIDQHDHDAFSVYITGGSHGSRSSILLGTISPNDDGTVTFDLGTAVLDAIRHSDGAMELTLGKVDR